MMNKMTKEQIERLEKFKEHFQKLFNDLNIDFEALVYIIDHTNEQNICFAYGCSRCLVEDIMDELDKGNFGEHLGNSGKVVH